MLNTMIELLAQLPTESQKATVRRHCEALRQGCISDLRHPDDRDAIECIFMDVNARWGAWPASDAREDREH
jgi:hypothetical protein